MAINLEKLRELIDGLDGYHVLNLDSDMYNNGNNIHFDDMERDYHILQSDSTGALKSVPLSHAISRIKAIGPVKDAPSGPFISVDEQINRLVENAIKPGGGLHYYTRSPNNKLRGADFYSQQFVSAEPTPDGFQITNITADKNAELATMPKKTHWYEDSPIGLFFAKLFSSKERGKEMQRAYDKFQEDKRNGLQANEKLKKATKAAVNEAAELYFTPSENRRKELVAEIYDKEMKIVNTERAKYEQEPTAIKKDNEPKEIVDEQQELAADENNHEYKPYVMTQEDLARDAEREKQRKIDDERAEKIKKIYESPEGKAKKEATLNMLEEHKKLYQNDPSNDKSVQKALNASKGLKKQSTAMKIYKTEPKDIIFEHIGAFKNPNPDQAGCNAMLSMFGKAPLRFGSIIKEMNTEGTVLNSKVKEKGGNFLAIPKGVIKAHIGKSYDANIADFLPDALRTADVKASNIAASYSEENLKPVAETLDATINVCNMLLKSMQPEEISKNLDEFIEIAEILRETEIVYNSSEDLKKLSTVNEKAHNTAKGWASLGMSFNRTKMERSSYLNSIDVHFKDNSLGKSYCADANKRVIQYDKAEKLFMDYLAKSQEQGLKSSPQAKESLNAIDSLSKNLWSDALGNMIIANTVPDYSFVEEIGSKSDIGALTSYNVIDQKGHEIDIPDDMDYLADSVAVANDVACKQYSIENESSPLAKALKSAYEKQFPSINHNADKVAEVPEKSMNKAKEDAQNSKENHKENSAAQL